jgi:hypothetical protein
VRLNPSTEVLDHSIGYTTYGETRSVSRHFSKSTSANCQGSRDISPAVLSEKSGLANRFCEGIDARLLISNLRPARQKPFAIAFVTTDSAKGKQLAVAFSVARFHLARWLWGMPRRPPGGQPNGLPVGDCPRVGAAKLWPCQTAATIR